MNRKGIQFKIERKVEHWLSSLGPPLSPEEIERIGNDVIVTGGCIVSMLTDEKINDYDIYFKSFETVKLIAEYYTQKFKQFPPEQFSDTIQKSLDIDVEVIENERVKIKIEMKDEPCVLFSKKFCEWLENVLHERTPTDELEPYRPLFLSSNAITLADGVQLIIRFFGSPDEIHKNYDYIHCVNYWTKETGLILNKKALESILTKDLYYQGSLYPICSIFRARKFIKRGWSITAGQLLKMLIQTHELDLANPDILEDQLIGVDTTEFGELINQVRQAKKFSLDDLPEMIDDIFC